mgnify:FL=1
MSNKEKIDYNQKRMLTDKIKDKKTSPLILLISTILVTCITCLIIYSFFSNYGITDDEAFYHYFLIHGFSETTFTFFHTFIHFLGKIFDHNLIGYRLLNFLLIVISINLAAYNSFLFYTKRDNSISSKDLLIFLNIVNVASYAFYAFIPTFSYTSSTIISINLWVAGIFYYFNNKGEFWSTVLIISSIYFALISRVHFAAAVYLVTPITLLLVSHKLGYSSKKFIYKILILSFCLTIIFLLIHSQYIRDIIPIIGLLSSGSHESLSHLYLEQIKQFITHKDFQIVYICIFSILIFHIIKFIFIKLNKNLYFSGSIIFTVIFLSIFSDLSGFYGHLFKINGTPSDGSHRIARYLLILIALAPIAHNIYTYIDNKITGRTNKKDDRLLILYCVCIIGSFFTGLGTGSNIVLWTSFSLGAISIPFVIFLYLQTNAFGSRKMLTLLTLFVVSLSVSGIIYREQIYQYRRNTLSSEQMFYSIESPHLKHIRIDKDSAESIDKLILTLRELSFDYNKDKIFAYTDVAGLVSSTKAKSFGEVWNQDSFGNFRELKNIETKICAYLRSAKASKDSKIYLLLSRPLTNKINKCLNERVLAKEPQINTFIGKIKIIPMIYNDFTKEYKEIRLIGPYQLK